MDASIVISVIGVVIALAAAAVAVAQAREARRSNAVSLLVPFYQNWQDPALKKLRQRLYAGDLDCTHHDLAAAEVDGVRGLLDRLEMLGAFVHNGTVDFQTVSTMFWRSPYQLWPYLEPLIHQRRQNGSPNYASNYERLYERYRKKFDAHGQTSGNA